MAKKKKFKKPQQSIQEKECNKKPSHTITELLMNSVRNGLEDYATDIPRYIIDNMIFKSMEEARNITMDDTLSKLESLKNKGIKYPDTETIIKVLTPLIDKTLEIVVDNLSEKYPFTVFKLYAKYTNQDVYEYLENR